MTAIAPTPPSEGVTVLLQEDNQDSCGCYGFYGGCFHNCRPDPDETNIIAYDKIKDRSAWFRAPKIFIRFNPNVTIAAIVIIWSFVAWCMVYPVFSASVIGQWKIWITLKFTWLYIGSQDVWALFIILVYFKYGHVKLGKDDTKPEYSDATWFTMLFSCGIGIGLFFFGVAEPLWHYDPSGGGNRYMKDSSMPDNTLAQNAINLTLYHWGVHAWVVYCLVGMLMGIVSYRMGLPMTVKSCFYPLIGDKIFGWLGDAIDTLSIVTTLFGVCTSLGFGVMQLNTGLNLLNENIPINTLTQVIIIWCITALATASTLTGLSLGIRRLSELCFSVGMVLMMMALFLSDTWYILNLYVQSIGFYFQWILQLGFHTDAFEQQGRSYGGTERMREYNDTIKDGPTDWMNSWTIFYWGWWIAWSPFVGMFIAKISKGRTIREFINGSMTAPIIYSFLWMCIFGGIGIDMERKAAGSGLCCNNNFNNVSILNASIAVKPNLLPGPWMCKGDCNKCAISLLNMEINDHNDSKAFMEKMIRMKKNFGVTFENRSLTRLSCHSKELMWFDVMDSYGSLAGFLRILSIIAIILYFVTSSDSGSFVIDCLAANGDEEPPRIQRTFWALSEGATCTALIWLGGEDALTALQTVSVATGLPYTIIICFMCVSLWRVLEADAGRLDPYSPHFKVGYFDLLARPSVAGVAYTLGNIIIAPYTFARAIVHTSTYKRKTCATITYTVFLSIFLFGFVILLICSVWVTELWAMGLVFFCGFIVAAGASRISMRGKYGIDGNLLEDIFSGLIYPMLAYQLFEQIRSNESNSGEDKSDDDIPMNIVSNGSNELISASPHKK